MRKVVKDCRDFWGKLKTKDRLVIVGSLAVLVVLAVSMLSPAAGKDVQAGASDSLTGGDAYRAYLEDRMKAALENVKGVGSVQVIIMLDGDVTKKFIYDTNRSENTVLDPSGRTSQQVSQTQTVVSEKTNTGTAPYLAGESYPKITGVMVIAQGAENSEAKYYIIEAIKATLDVPAHKIVVLPMKK